MENFLPVKITVNKEYRGLIPDTEFDFSETLFLLDNNGAGKSTLLKGIIAANQDKNKRVNLDINNMTPDDVIDLPMAGISKIGYFGQDSNMKTLGYLPDEDMDISLSALKSSSGEGVYNQVIHLIKNNDIIILDEPSTSLSILSIRRIAYIIKKVIEGGSGKSFIISDHNETFLKHFKEESAYRVNGERITVNQFLEEQYSASI